MPTTLLTLPVEIRLKIYNYVFSTSNIHSFRPQRKIGWNRPYADLSNPAILFESESHPVLRQLFHSKVTKLDHAVILTALLHHAKVLVVTHEDFSALQKLAASVTLPSVALGMSSQARNFAAIVKEKLRCIDFNDKLDDVVCQPSDLVKLLNAFTGLKTICVASKHVQRYSGTVNEHIEFAKDRAEQKSNPPTPVVRSSSELDMPNAADEFRRMSLRSPMTDGSRMMISPALLSGNRQSLLSAAGTPRWVVVDLSMIVWQHFLYTGAPYRDHWRCVKMQTLLDTAEKQNACVVMSVRNIEFDPAPSGARRVLARRAAVHPDVWKKVNRKLSGTFRGEMSTENWILRLRNRSDGVEFSIRQRRQFDEPVSQEACGLTRCRHRRRASSLCDECATETEI